MVTESAARICQGFVLVGGASLRFGTDKALAMYQGEALVAWAVQALTEVGLSATLVGPEVTPYRRWCNSTVTSETPGLGPAEGVRAAMGASRCDWALILGVDMPQVTGAVLRPLLAAAKPDRVHQVICYADPPARIHPFPGLYHGSLLAVMDRLGRGGSMRRLLDVAATRLIVQDDLQPGVDLAAVLCNVNRPEDLAG